MKVQVGVVQIPKPRYPDECHYHPSEAYPEYPFQGYIANQANHVYAGVRQLLLELGFDGERWGTPEWNPLGHLIQPGMTVVINPNFVLSSHAAGKDIFSIITHPSVLRAIADYCWIALKGDGRIIIADAPQYDCDFNELLKWTKLDEICDFYSMFSDPSVEFLDLRNYYCKGNLGSKTRHFPSMRHELPGDPQGIVKVDLGKKSALYTHPHPERFYGAVYHRNETINHHTGEWL